MNIHKYETSAIFSLCLCVSISFIRPFGCVFLVCRSYMWHSILTWMCQLLASLNINQWHLIIPFHRFWQTKQNKTKSRVHVCRGLLGKRNFCLLVETRFEARSVNFRFVFINIRAHACSWHTARAKCGV